MSVFVNQNYGEPILPNVFITPHLVKIDDYQLPEDVRMKFNASKEIAVSKIIDGVVVFERINRNFFEIVFEFTARGFGSNKTREPKSIERRAVGGNLDKSLSEGDEATDIFQQTMIVNTFKNIWLPNVALKVENTILNGLEIATLIVKDFDFQTVTGTKSVPCRLTCWEVFQGVENQKQTLIVS